VRLRALPVGVPPLNFAVRRMGKVTSAIFQTAAALAGVVLSLGAKAACFDPKAIDKPGPLISGYEMPVSEEIGLTEVIAIGKVVRSRLVVSPDDPEGYEATIYTVQVERVLKGRLPSKVKLYSSNTTSRYFMERGERHILFLTSAFAEMVGISDYFVDNCGNSSTLPKGDAVVKQVEAILKQGRVRSGGSSQRSRRTEER
jgi:hypothetical protein